LIALAIQVQLRVRHAFYVRRKRDFTQGVQLIFDIPAAFEAQAAMTFIIDFSDSAMNIRGLSARIVNHYLSSDPRAFARPQQTPPIVAIFFCKQKNFELPACFGIYASQSSGDHPRIIEHKDVARAQILKEIVEMPMKNPARIALENQKARLVAVGQGNLGN
jgi:hypothetical protein